MNKKLKALFLFVLVYIPLFVNSQTTPLAGDYKVIFIGDNGVGDYTKSLILLHEIYNGTTLIDFNNAIGTITAFRGSTGSYSRINVVEINSFSAYAGTLGSLKSFDGSENWTLKTCTYNGKKYVALDVPYSAAYHDRGYKFSGWTNSTGENMKAVAYEVSGSPVNTNILSNIQDFTPNLNETHKVNNFLILGNNVGIGTANPTSKLTVAGNINSREVKVTVDAGADFVFAKDYDLPSLDSVDKFIKENKHLPEIASAAEMQKDGINLSEMNIKLLQKIEELTLYVIVMKNENDTMKADIVKLKTR